MKYYIIFDKNGEMFFLIGKKIDWCLFSSENDLPVRISYLNKVSEIPYENDVIEIYESNMNLPVEISSNYKSYLWATKSSVLSKLNDKELRIFEEALKSIL